MEFLLVSRLYFHDFVITVRPILDLRICIIKLLFCVRDIKRQVR